MSYGKYNLQADIIALYTSGILNVNKLAAGVLVLESLALRNNKVQQRYTVLNIRFNFHFSLS
jgi:hypothetical protein